MSDPFDLDEWIAGARRPRRAVTIYQRPDLVADHSRLNADLVEASGTDRDHLAAQVRDLEQQMRDSALELVVEAQDAATLNRLRKEAAESGGDVDEWFVTALVAAAVVEPGTITRDQVTALRGAIGEGQFQQLLAAADGVSIGSVTVPFSLAASAATKRPGSSQT